MRSRETKSRERKEQLQSESKQRMRNIQPKANSSERDFDISSSLEASCSVGQTYQTDREWKDEISQNLHGASDTPSNDDNTCELLLPQTNRARNIMDGFRIQSMQMKDADTGTVLWEASNWGPDTFSKETVAHVPADILKCRAISRDIVFSSREQISNFRLEQRIFLHGNCIEEWSFDFGFVMPNSTNTWSQTIESAGESKMIPVEVLNGNVTIETSFIEGDTTVSKTVVRLFYV